VGEALTEAFAKGIKREDMFITTKLWHSGYSDVEGALKESLAKMKLDYVDMYLIHFPMGVFCEPKMPLHILWPKMEAVVENGMTRGIGVSNMNTQIIWDLLTYAKIAPACNQVELNPQHA
jgi:diketogulonate reductase-like aldo/keto reductase